MTEERTGVRLIMADDTVIENGRAGETEGRLWCIFPGTMMDAFGIFFNPAKTSVIRFQYGDMEESWEGYTNCTNIFTMDNEAHVCMRKVV